MKCKSSRHVYGQELENLHILIANHAPSKPEVVMKNVSRSPDLCFILCAAFPKNTSVAVDSASSAITVEVAVPESHRLPLHPTFNILNFPNEYYHTTNTMSTTLFSLHYVIICAIV
jgi:hypothetical protein